MLTVFRIKLSFYVYVFKMYKVVLSMVTLLIFLSISSMHGCIHISGSISSTISNFPEL